MRRLAWFFALGAALLVAKNGLQWALVRTPSPILTVDVKASASRDERESAIDEAVLIEEALRSGGALIDPVVREQLLTTMRMNRAVSGRQDDVALIESALALGLHRADPVTRQRLAFQAEQLLTARVSSTVASDAQLTEYLQRNQRRYAQAARYSFRHVFLSRARRGESLTADAEALRGPLSRAPTRVRHPGDTDHHQGATDDGASEWLAWLGDPSLLPPSFDAVDSASIDARFGAGFAAALATLPLDTWSGPIASSYGLHWILLGQRLDPRLPALDEVRARLIADYRHDRRRALLRERLRALRAHYRIDVRTRSS